MKVIPLILLTVFLLIASAFIGYIVATKIVISNSKIAGSKVTYLPEKIVEIQTKNITGIGVHFRGKSGKQYSCSGTEARCDEAIVVPNDKRSSPKFSKSDSLYPKFHPPPSKPKQIVIYQKRGLVGHKNVWQYALLEDGTVWSWMYSGNEMGDSFPFWHLNNWMQLAIGLSLGIFFGILLSGLVWVLFYPRK